MLARSYLGHQTVPDLRHQTVPDLPASNARIWSFGTETGESNEDDFGEEEDVDVYDGGLAEDDFGEEEDVDVYDGGLADSNWYAGNNAIETDHSTEDEER